MQFLGNLVVPGGGSVNNKTTATPFQILEKFTSLLVITPASASGFNIVVGDSPGLTSNANEYLVAGSTLNEIKCPNETPLETVVAVYGVSGGTCEVYGLYGTALIDATNHGGGGGSGVTSIAVTQGLTASGATGAVTLGTNSGGDLSGALDLATVVGIQGTPVSATVPTDGQVLTYSLANLRWEPAAAPGGGLPYAQATGQTTTGTPTIPLYSVAIPLTTISDIDIKIVAIETASLAYARFERRVLISNPTGSAQLVQTMVPTPDNKTAGAAAWSVSVGVSGANFELTVTGAPSGALDTVKWEAILTPTQLTY